MGSKFQTKAMVLEGGSWWTKGEIASTKSQGRGNVMMSTIFLSHIQVRDIATYLNKKINIPFIGEESEQVIFEGLIDLVARSAISFIPAQWGQFLNDNKEGFDPARKDELVEWLTSKINAVIDVPLMGEEAEAAIIRPVVEVIIGGLMMGATLDEETSEK